VRFEDYTADFICRSLGLEQFVDPGWGKSEATAIRIVLKPSFHPEVVITITRIGTDVFVSTIAARNRIWGPPFPQTTDSDADHSSAQWEVFSPLVEAFDAEFIEAKIERRSICLDGMGVELCFVSGPAVQQFKTHVSGSKSADELVARGTQLAWGICRSPRVKNALPNAAAYVGLRIPQVQLGEPEPKKRVGIMLLGTPDAKEGLAEAVQNRDKHRKE